ncbi:MAG: aminotransferase class IV [Bacteroidota bacterium]|nr:aminotransferase class IV [Bacteroidota bacterium]
MVEHFFIYNDKVYINNSPVVSAANRGLRYGDGLFETMKCVNGKIINANFHFERLFAGLSLLQFDVPKQFTKDFILKKIGELCNKNKHNEHVRIRLMIFRGNGGIFDPENHLPNYIIESWELPGTTLLNENGQTIDIFPDARKSCDSFSNIKSNNYLPYTMAALYAKKNKLNDCMLLNSFERICDSVIANIFIIKENDIYTPPLSEGCVAGTMRRWMLKKFTLENYQVSEKILTVDDLLNADEVFLTNAIYYIKWVKSFRDKNYSNISVREIFNKLLQTIDE